MAVLNPKPRPPGARIWHALRIHRGPWTLDEIEAESEAKAGAVSTMVQRLVKVGYVKRSRKPGRGTPAQYVLAKNTGPVVPILKKDGTVDDPNVTKVTRISQHQRMWTFMRQHPEFTVNELVAGTEVPYRSVTWFMSHLQEDGHIERVGANRGTAHHPAKWRLVKDIGPVPPSFSSKRKAVSHGE